MSNLPAFCEKKVPEAATSQRLPPESRRSSKTWSIGASAAYGVNQYRRDGSDGELAKLGRLLPDPGGKTVMVSVPRKSNTPREMASERTAEL